MIEQHLPAEPDTVRPKSAAPTIDLVLEQLLLRTDVGCEVLKEELLQQCRQHNLDEHRALEKFEQHWRKLTLYRNRQVDPGPEHFLFQVKQYRCISRLGAGKSGQVYRAHDLILGRLVAIKQIPITGMDPARAQGEADRLAKLDHAHIVKVHERFELDGHLYIVMAFHQGQTLEEALGARTQQMPPQQAAELVRTLALAIHEAHLKKVVHRDLKPANIVLREGKGRPEPIIIDFGLAKDMGPGASTQTAQGEILGTPSYMAPEQACGLIDQVGPHSDVHALGAILYECLTGLPPFRGESAAATIEQVCNHEPVPPHVRDSRVPRDLAAICLRCLEKVPSLRYASALALAEDLQRYQEGKATLARPVGFFGQTWKFLRRRPLVSSLAAVALLALIGGTVISILFAVHASNKEKETLAALGQVDETLATALLRPLGPFLNEEKLNDFELGALLELASLPRERDRVRLHFVRQALGAPGTARQLSRRIEPAMVAAVGLRQDLRQRVIEMAAASLKEAASAEQRLAATLVLAQMDVDDPEVAFSAAQALLGWSASNGYTFGGKNRGESFATLARKVSQVQAEQLAQNLTRQVDKVLFLPDLEGLSAGFAAVAPRLARPQAETHACKLAQTITRRLQGLTTRVEIAMLEPAPPDQQWEVVTLSLAFALIAPYLPEGEEARKQAQSVMQRLIREIQATAPNQPVAHWTKAFATLASRLPAGLRGGRRADADIIAQEIIKRCQNKPKAWEMRDLTSAFDAIIPWLPDRKAAANAATIAEAIVGALKETPVNQLFTSGEPPERPLTILAPRLSATDSARIAGLLLQVATKTDDPGRLHTVVRAFACVAGRLPANEQKSPECIRIGRDLLTKTMQSDLPRVMGEGVQALVALPGWDTPEQVAGLRKRVYDLAARAGSGDDLVPLAVGWLALEKKFAKAVDGEEAAKWARQLLRFSNLWQEDDLVESTLAALADHASCQALVDLLKEPGCVRMGRRRVLEILGRKLELRKAPPNAWELLDQLQLGTSELDFGSPLPRLPFVPRERDREPVL
jgi:hypothetical protein